MIIWAWYVYFTKSILFLKIDTITSIIFQAHQAASGDFIREQPDRVSGILNPQSMKCFEKILSLLYALQYHGNKI
jgi:hypothetical protein